MSKSAPVRIRSMMMGLWFATTFPADILAGYLGSFWSSMAKANFFLMIAAIAALGGVLMAASASRTLRSLLEPRLIGVRHGIGMGDSCDCVDERLRHSYSLCVENAPVSEG